MAKLTINKNPDKGKLTNSGTKELAKMKLITSIVTERPFVDLFPINPIVLTSIEEGIVNNGFDNSQVLHVWVEKNILLDGHTRLQAAKNCNLKQLPVYEHSFESEEDALEYAISLQRNRRNLTDAEMMSCLSQLDRLKEPGRKLASNEANSFKGKSASITADLLGTSRSKVEKMRSIKKHGSKDILKEVSDGDKSINRAYIETSEVRKNKIELEPTLASQVSHSDVTYKYTLVLDENSIYLKSVNSDVDVERIQIVFFNSDNPIFLKDTKSNLLSMVHEHLEPIFNNYLLKSTATE